jgi:RNA polymerase sigma factor (sigma-70 family)
MSTHVVYNGIDAAEKARIQAYWEKKLPRLQKLLTNYRPELVEIRLTVSHRGQTPKNKGYELRGVIQLPTGTLAADAQDKDPLPAVDRIVDALVNEIKRHKELVRHDFVYKRKFRNREDLSAAGPILQKHADEGRQEDFYRVLRPHLRFLRDYARRELRILESQGLLHRREATVGDLLDEVLAQAWEQFPSRPRNMSLDLWLTNLMLDTLERWIKEEPRRHLSLEEKASKVMPDEVPKPDETEWWAELLGEEENPRLGDLIPDTESTASWYQLTLEEQEARIQKLLADLSPTQRQAFLLYALEDYNTAEIAMLQDRPEEQVKADIEAARKLLRDRLLASGYVREKKDTATESASATAAASTGK